MIRIDSHITIARPVSEVYAWVADLANLPRWQSGVVRSHVVDPGPLRVGTRFEEDVRVVVFGMKARCVVTDLEPDRRMAFDADAGPLTYKAEFVFDDVSGATDVRVTATAQMKGAWRLLQPLFAMDARRSVQDELNRIRGHLEAA